MESSLRAGVVLYTAGDTHAAHEPWEAVWLDLPAGDDELLFHGLIQFAGTIYHAETHNWSGAVGLAERAQQYLDPLPARYRGIDTDAVATSLTGFERDPARIEREPRPPLTYAGGRLSAAATDREAIAIAAETLAAAGEIYEEHVVDSAIAYAREEAQTARSTWTGMLARFVDERANRGLIYDRLRRKVERRAAKREDVSGLFD